MRKAENTKKYSQFHLLIYGLFFESYVGNEKAYSRTTRAVYKLNFAMIFPFTPHKCMHWVQFITSLPPPLQKRELKQKPNALLGYPVIWLQGAPGTLFHGPREPQMSTGPCQPGPASQALQLNSHLLSILHPAKPPGA